MDTPHAIQQAVIPIYKEWQKCQEEDWWEGIDIDGRILDVNICLSNTDTLPCIDVYECEEIEGSDPPAYETKTGNCIASFDTKQFH